MFELRFYSRVRYQAAAVLLLSALAGGFCAAVAGFSPLEARLTDFLRAQIGDRTEDPAATASIEIRGPRIDHAVCHTPQPFLPRQGQRMKGAMTVGVRCPGDRPATLYFQAYVRTLASYVVAARALAPDTRLTAADVRQIRGDTTRLSPALAHYPGALIGQVTVRRIGQGMPLTTDMVRRPELIRRGQRVRVVADGRGFSITTHGQALNAAAQGQSVRVKTDAGRVVTGTGTAENTVTLRR